MHTPISVLLANSFIADLPDAEHFHCSFAADISGFIKTRQGTPDQVHIAVFFVKFFLVQSSHFEVEYFCLM